MAIKKIKKTQYNLSPTEQKLCHGIIHSASGSAATVGAGLAQLPLADNAIITPIQITMIISLGKVFGQEITKTVAKGLLGGFIANFVGRGVAQAAWGWIPGIGNASNAITAAAVTESIGWLCVDHFYKEKYLKGVTVNTAEYKNENKETSTENFAEMFEKREELKSRADEFLNGEKTRKGNKDEYKNLLNDFENILSDLDDESDELYEYHENLLQLR